MRRMQSSRLQPTGCHPRPATCPNPFCMPCPNPFCRPGASGPAPGPAKAQLRPVPQAQRQSGCPEAEKPRLDLDISSRRPWLTTLCKRAVNAVAGCTTAAFGFVSHTICQDTGIARSSVVCQASSDSEGSTSGAGLPERDHKATLRDGSGGSGSPGPDAQATLHDEPRDLSKAMVDNLQLEQPSEGDNAVVAAFQRLVDRTAGPGVKDVLMLNQAKLVKEEVTSEEALQGLTLERLMAFKLSMAAAKALKEAFPSSTATDAGVGVPSEAPCGPIRHNLSEAATISPEASLYTDPCYFQLEKTSAEGLVMHDFYIDAGGSMQRELTQWLDACHTCQTRTNTFTSQVKPLFVNGLTKTGKTFLLTHILPALARQHPSFGVQGGPQQAVLCQLTMSKIPNKLGYTSQLQGLLLKLMRWAADQNVPVAQAKWSEARAALSASSVAALQYAIMGLWQGISTNVIVTLDEVQSWYLPLAQDGSLDMAAAAQARDFMKNLLLDTPNNIMVAVTGSSMATFWTNVAMTPRGGLSLMLSQTQLNVPAEVPEFAMQRCWEHLVGHTPTLATVGAKLYDFCAKSPAMLVYLAEHWVGSNCPDDISEFVLRHFKDKLFMEALEDWGLFLNVLQRERRVYLYNLSSLSIGVELGRLVDVGLAQMLQAYVRPVAPGSPYSCLRSPEHRELIQLLMKPDGELGSMWQAVPAAGGLAHLEARELLLRLANTVVEGSKSRWQGQAFLCLQQDLRDLAADMEKRHGAAATWSSQIWFKRVLQSPYNREAAPAFRKDEANLQPWQVVARYLCMLRNCLAHQEFDEDYIIPDPGQLIAQFKADDVDLMETCPLAPTLHRIGDVVGPIEYRYLSHCQAASPSTFNKGQAHRPAASPGTTDKRRARGKAHPPAASPNTSNKGRGHQRRGNASKKTLPKLSATSDSTSWLPYSQMFTPWPTMPAPRKIFLNTFRQPGDSS